MARHRAQQDRRVAHRARNRPCLIERGREGDDSPTRATPVGRFDADGSGKRRGLADRAAGVRRRRTETEPRGDRRRRASRRAARNEWGIRAPPPPGRNHGAEIRGLVR